MGRFVPVDGQHYQAGEVRTLLYSVHFESLVWWVAMRHYPEEYIWQRVGKILPARRRSIRWFALERKTGIPRNPFGINAGALVVCDMLQRRLSAPRQRMLKLCALCGTIIIRATPRSRAQRRFRP
ncbi:glutaminase [Salmonella enterica subsp. enterica]|nr:glutaminase [Salmonella enterica subsp. enterica]